ncbi:MAG: conjugative transfer protein MobI(A/C) [Thermodesulfobacteriota bacterium]
MHVVSQDIDIDLDKEVASLSAKASSLVQEVQDLLKSQKPQKYKPDDPHETRAKSIWIQLKQQNGYETVSIIWRYVKYFHQRTQRPYYQDIARGRGYCMPRARFMAAVRGYHTEIQKELWEYEKEFARIRQKQALLSQARGVLVQFQKMAGKQ